MEANDPEVDYVEDESSEALSVDEKEDRISALPDLFIHHILSYLPSTKEAIQTSILSKRWQYQWAYVPVLVFNSGGDEEKAENFARFIDNTLHLYNCSKMKKFHINYRFEKDANFTSKVRFAMRKDVEELILRRYCASYLPNPYMLPKFILECASLVKLEIVGCDFKPSWKINWPSLKVLKMNSRSLNDTQSIENVLSGSPSLESLELIGFSWWVDNFVKFASTSLKILILVELTIDCDVEFSCPNLEQFSVKMEDTESYASLTDKLIKDSVSRSPLLHTLELNNCCFDELDIINIASKSMKKIVLSGLYEGCAVEISCPNLVELELYGLDINKCKLWNLPSSCRATLHFKTPPSEEYCGETLARKILEELHRMKQLNVFFSWFVEILSALEIGQLSNYPLLNIKHLTLSYPNFVHISGIANALRCSPLLERLVIKLRIYKHRETADLDLNNLEETCLDSNGAALTCLMPHLKTVKIVGLSDRDGEFEVILRFVEFILENAIVLEKMTVVLEDAGTDFLVKVSRKLLSFPRWSRRAIVELL